MLSRLVTELKGFSPDEKKGGGFFGLFKKAASDLTQMKAKFDKIFDGKKEEEGYRVVAEKLRSVLPHLKVIGANGLAELFCSKYILQLLSEWHLQGRYREGIVYFVGL